MGEGRVTVLTFSANKERRDKEEDGVHHRQTETRTCLFVFYCTAYVGMNVLLLPIK